MTEVVIKFGDVEQTVGVKARKFPCGGSWSSFLCSSCGVQVRVLRLLAGGVLYSLLHPPWGAVPR